MFKAEVFELVQDGDQSAAQLASKKVAGHFIRISVDLKTVIHITFNHMTRLLLRFRRQVCIRFRSTQRDNSRFDDARQA